MHFFELAGPDLLLGFDADPAIRNVVGVIQANPELALKAVRSVPLVRRSFENSEGNGFIPITPSRGRQCAPFLEGSR